jgi:DNA-binding HxlR family transcriptional regulator
MANFEEETYSTVFTSLRHPIRRKILRTLSAGPQNFSDLQRTLGIESSHLAYHLEGLANLLLRTDDGKYTLSSLGKTAVSTMKQVEEPPHTPLRVSFSLKKWKLLVAALTIGITVLSALFYFEYQNLSMPKNQYSNLIDRYSMSGSVETALAKNETSELNGTDLTAPMGHTKVYSFDSLADNSTLEIEIQLHESIERRAHVSLAVCVETIHPSIAYVGTLDKSSDPWGLNASRQVVEWAHSYEMIWDDTAANHSEYSVHLPSNGRYYLQIEGPIEWNATEYHTVEYTLTIQIQYQGDYVPFFVGSEQESCFFPPW